MVLSPSLLAAAVGVSAAHAALPSHWLPFVLVGRARRWGAARTLGVAALAATLHVATTVLFGFAAAAGAHLAVEHAGAWTERAIGLLLVVLGLWLAIRRPHAHSHGHPVCPDDPAPPAGGSDRLAVAGLVGMLMISPCEAAVPLFFLAGQSVAAVLALGAVVGASTLVAMLGLVALTWWGLASLHLHFLEDREGLVNGLVLAGLGAAVLLGR